MAGQSTNQSSWGVVIEQNQHSLERLLKTRADRRKRSQISLFQHPLKPVPSYDAKWLRADGTDLEAGLFVEALGSKVEYRFDLLARNGILLDDLVNRHAVFKIFKDDFHWGARVAERPRAAHLTRDAFHRRALRPVEIGHVFSMPSKLQGLQDTRGTQGY